MSIIFRWSVWGMKKSILTLLPHSVRTFQAAFGSDARYVVGTDRPSEIRSLLPDRVETLAYGSLEPCPFEIDSRPTWRKWCPTVRLDPSRTEFYVDSDLFLVGDPVELRRFATATEGPGLLVMPEPPNVPFYVGNFASRIPPGIPPVNTGLLGQRPGTDITRELLVELQWWSRYVSSDRHSLFDEQGAVTAVLAKHYAHGDLELLPWERYRVVNHFVNDELTDLSGVAAIHATADHMAFKRFRRHIEASELYESVVKTQRVAGS